MTAPCCAGLFARAVEFFGQRAIENVVDQRALAAAADAGDDGHDAEREVRGDVLQVVGARAFDGEPFAGERPRALSGCAGVTIRFCRRDTGR
jgi:hypothetical protein